MGQLTAAVLAERGSSDERIAELKETKIIGPWRRSRRARDAAQRGTSLQMLCEPPLPGRYDGMGPPIVVMGVSGSGKSTVGKALAQRLRVPFADADDFHPPANIAKMTAGHALDDNDRFPWLEAIGDWLAEHCGGGVMSCSALKRKYRDQLRNHCAQVQFLHLTGSPEVIGRRQASRPGHFMPRSLLASQFDTLEPLQPDEDGVTIDVDQDIDSIVETYLRSTEQETR
jgi:gluconokinase